MSFKQFIPAQGDLRPKHLVQLWTDPGGLRTLSVGSIRLKDPKRVAAAKERHKRERAATADDDRGDLGIISDAILGE